MKADWKSRDLRSGVYGRQKGLTTIICIGGNMSRINLSFPTSFGTAKILAQKRGSRKGSMTSKISSTN